MAEKVVMVETSILIDFYRKTDKNNSDTLKQQRKQIALADLLIASTAIANGFPLATLNKDTSKELKCCR